jgi:putative inorganic carbon (hco3(-)) transporter
MERLAFNVGLPAAVIPSPAEVAPAPATPVPAVSEADHDQDLVAFRWLLAFTCILFMRPQDELPLLQFLHLADITAIGALVALGAGRASRGAPILRLTPELRLVLALGAMMLATAPLSVWPGGAVAVFTDLFSKVIVVFALMLNTVTTKRRLELFVGVVVAGTSYIAVRTVADYLRGINLVEGYRASGAVSGLFGNPNDMALNMIAFLPLAVIVALRRGRPLLRFVAMVGIPFIVASVIFSKSRGGLVALVAMLAVLLFQLRRLRPGIGALVLAGALASLPFLPQTFTDRMSSIFNPKEDPTGSREARKRLLRDGYQAFIDNPVFGLGAGQFQNYNPEGRKEEAWRETHNAVLQVAAELGIVGLAIFLIVIGSGFAAVIRTAATLRRARGRRRARAPDPARHGRETMEMYAAAMAASLTGWFVAAMFASVAYYWTFYIVLGLAASLRDIVQQDHPESGVARPAAWRRAA